MYTQTITVKVDKDTNELLFRLAKKSKRRKSEIVRCAIETFIKSEMEGGAGASLLRMAKEAKRYKYEAPKDIVENMNKYLYGKT